VDLKQPQGQALLQRLAAHCDVVVENYRVGALARYGLDQVTLRAMHPHLVYCSITGFGQNGPRASQPGYDAAVQALGGLMSITGAKDHTNERDSESAQQQQQQRKRVKQQQEVQCGVDSEEGVGEMHAQTDAHVTADGQHTRPPHPPSEPTKVGVAVADLFTSTYAATAILAALHSRDRHSRRSGAARRNSTSSGAEADEAQARQADKAPTHQTDEVPTQQAGEAHVEGRAEEAARELAAEDHQRSGLVGAYIDLALFDVQLAMLANQALNCLTTDRSPTRLGNSHPNIVPYTTVPTADGHLMLCVGSDLQYRRFCAAAHAPGTLADDPRFATNKQRVAHRHLLMPALEGFLRTQPTAHWLQVCLEAGVPASPVNSVHDALTDPQTLHRCMVVQARDGGKLLGNPIKMPGLLDDPPPSYLLPPPHLSQHTDEVLSTLLQCSEEEIAQLHRDQVV
jgi:crotonobetainyl-CoA:carnitine CoA-transferase CaiB-like acyl-CoA transferase